MESIHRELGGVVTLVKRKTVAGSIAYIPGLKIPFEIVRVIEGNGRVLIRFPDGLQRNIDERKIHNIIIYNQNEVFVPNQREIEIFRLLEKIGRRVTVHIYPNSSGHEECIWGVVEKKDSPMGN